MNNFLDNVLDIMANPANKISALVFAGSAGYLLYDINGMVFGLAVAAFINLFSINY